MGEQLGTDISAHQRGRVPTRLGSDDRQRQRPRKLHAYFIAFALVFALFVITGFSRTFFIPLARGTFSRPLIVPIHGALFFTWTVILLLQAILAATKQLRLHRAIGSFAGWLIVPMLLMGTLVAVRGTLRDFHTGQGDAALSFFYGELADLTMFGLLAGSAMVLRNRPDFHKRLVVLGSLGLLGAATIRIPEIRASANYILLGFIASVATYDLISRRAVHLATVIGAVVLLTLAPTEELIGNAHAWISASHYLLHV